jgi:hypothetical protein
LTIALSIKISDGIVLAADSAGTSTSTHTNGTSIVRVYNNANKVLNLHKEIPVGIITWGNGSIGRETIATIVKDFRKQITDGQNKIHPSNYKIEDIAHQFYTFIHDKYCNEYGSLPPDQLPYTGFTIAGYSSSENHPEEWSITLASVTPTPPTLQSKPEDSGRINWAGKPEAISRLVNGVTMNLKNILLVEGYSDTEADKIAYTVSRNASAPIINDAMPIKDAIDIAEFLIDVTAKFGKYTLGDQSVGGPIEIAAITKHEGFKWVNRKLYFSNEFNFGREN